MCLREEVVREAVLRKYPTHGRRGYTGGRASTSYEGRGLGTATLGVQLHTDRQLK